MRLTVVFIGIRCLRKKYLRFHIIILHKLILPECGEPHTVTEHSKGRKLFEANKTSLLTLILTLQYIRRIQKMSREKFIYEIFWNCE